MALNFTIIHGRLTRDPELKQTAGGIEACNFTVAVDRPKNKNGEKAADFFYCAAYRERAQLIAHHFAKGREIIVTGKLQSRRFVDRDNVERTVWELVVDSFDFCGSKADGTAGSAKAEAVPTASYMPDAYAQGAPALEAISDDEELPF